MYLVLEENSISIRTEIMKESKFNGLVSVVTPAYNCENYIQACIESVSKQTTKVLEHIVVDDGSSDGTRKVLKELTGKYPFLKVIYQNNKGAGAARNRAILEAKGRYIAFLDSDDLWLPDKIKNQIGYMEANQHLFTYGDYFKRYVDCNEVENIKSTPAKLTYKQLLVSCPIGCLTAAYNQEVLGKIFMSEIRQGQDWSLWLRITQKGVDAYKYDGCLAIYNVFEGSLSSRKLKKLVNMYRIYREQGFNIIISTYYLFLHTFNVLRRH